MQITRLEYQKKDPNRVNVYVDGKFAVGLDVNAVISLGLHNGQEISSERMGELLSQSEFGKAFNLALNFLSFRPRSEWEIRTRLKLKKASNIEEVIQKLQSLGQVDDVAFAKWFVDQRRTYKPKGKRALVSELLQKGVAKKIIDQALVGDVSELQQAQALAEKKFAKKELDPEKVSRFLVSRGFDWETIKSVLGKLGQKEYND